MAELTIAEAARRLDINAETLRTRIRRGQVEARKDATRHWRVSIPEAPIGGQNGTGQPGHREPGHEPTTEPVNGHSEPGRNGHGDATAAGLLALIERQQVAHQAQLAVKDAQIAARDAEITEMRREHAKAEEQWRVLLQTSQRLIPPAVVDTIQAQARPRDNESPLHAQNVAPVGAQQASEPSPRPRSAWWRRFIFGEE